jgi:ZIP family zinc transporter
MLINLILYAGFAGVTVSLGGILANVFNHHMPESPVKYEITHGMMSFGSGIILSALALVLIPKGMEQLEVIPMALTFLLGAVLFMLSDSYLAKMGGKNAMLLAMMMDFVPESIALGAVFSVEPASASLLAIFIGLQNLPEAFNAFRDLVQSGFKAKKAHIIFFFLSFSGIAAALIGHFILSDYPKTTAHLMIFASGGILYLLIQDIIPESKLNKKYTVSLGACLGFLVGLIGEKII